MEEDFLSKIQKTDADYWDIRYIRSWGTDLELKNGELKKAVIGEEFGAGVRVLYKGSWGFASTNLADKEQIFNTFEAAYRLAKTSSRKLVKDVSLADTKTYHDDVHWKPKIDPSDVDIEEKYKIIKDLSSDLRANDEIITVETGYSDGNVEKHFLNSEGSDIRAAGSKVMVQANLIAKRGPTIMGFRTRKGGTGGLEFVKEEDLMEMSRRAKESVITLLGAERAPSGRFPVVMDPDLTGVFIHEAVGHATEADLVTTGDSILEGKIGEMIGSELVTVVDDSTIPGAFGSFMYDDEGVLGSKKVLIDKGVLNGYILNRETAHKLDMNPNGGARAESFASRPLVRMSNTMVLAGDSNYDELFEGIKLGVFAKGSRGGEVDTARGTFQFNAQEAFLIEDGQVTKPLRDVSLSGLTLETLENISALEKEARLGSPGFCGKGQLVPVGDGGPHMRIKEVMVGGGQ